MESSDKNYLLDRLTETHAAIQIILVGVDLELRVYSDSDWRIRDILGHIATRDREIAKSMRAFLTESEYVISDLDDDESGFNAKAVMNQRTLSSQQIVAEWEDARDDLKAVIRDIPEDWFPGNLIFPWGDEHGSIKQLVEYFIQHDEEHKDEILKAIKTQPKE